MPHPSDSCRFYDRKIFGGEYGAYSSSLGIILRSSVKSSLLGLSRFLSILFLNTLSLFSSLNVRELVSHP
jgi:hypothetical protein